MHIKKNDDSKNESWIQDSGIKSSGTPNKQSLFLVEFTIIKDDSVTMALLSSSFRGASSTAKCLNLIQRKISQSFNDD